MMVGVLVAVALLSSTPLYSNALNDLGLAHALREKPIELLDVHIYARSYHIDLEDYSRGRELVDRRASRNIGALVRQEERYIKSQTFSVVWADRPTPDGPDRPKGYFQVFTNLEKHVALLEGRYPDPLPSGLSQEELADTGLEIEAMIGSEAAETFGVGLAIGFFLSIPEGTHQNKLLLSSRASLTLLTPRKNFGSSTPRYSPDQSMKEWQHPSSFQNRPFLKVLAA